MREIPMCGVVGPDGRKCFYGTNHGRSTHSWQDGPPNKWDAYEKGELAHAHGVCDEATCPLCEAYRRENVDSTVEDANDPYDDCRNFPR